MLKRVNEKQLYFSTKAEIRIHGVAYRPSICYKVPAGARESLEKHKAVTFHEGPVRFVNGQTIKLGQSPAHAPVPSVMNKPGKESKKKRAGKVEHIETDETIELDELLLDIDTEKIVDAKKKESTI